MRLYINWYPVEKSYRYVFKKLQVIVCIRPWLRDISYENWLYFFTPKRRSISLIIIKTLITFIN